MRTQIIALFFFLAQALMARAYADDRLYFYMECSPGQQCIDLTDGHGKTDWVAAIPAQILTKADVTSARVQTGAGTARSLILELNQDASRKFEGITGENIGRRLAIVFDNRILTMPTINAPITDRMITIHGGGEQEPFWEKASWLKELIQESYGAGGRALPIYGTIVLAVSISALVYVFLSKMKRKRHSDPE